MNDPNTVIVWRRKGERRWNQRQPFFAEVLQDSIQVGFPIDFETGTLPNDWPTDCTPVLCWVSQIGLPEGMADPAAPWTLFVEAS